MTTQTPHPDTATLDAASAPIRVAVSTVIFTLRPDSASGRPSVVLPLVRRTRDPHHGQLALPGGWLDAGEDLASAAARTLAETTGLQPSYLEQLYAFGAVDRSPTRVVSIVYWALIRADEAAVAAEVENVTWRDAAALPPLAFDHNAIIDYALWRLRNKVGYSQIAHGLVADEFTVADLREAYEAVLGRTLDPANFRRQIEGTSALLPTDRYRTGSHRPARIYRSNPDVELADRGPLTETRTP
ncbi:MAG TPA: NUDIX domain-containing protein [Microbacteriaceae bacterium]|nr:NUDIX domain-containing protein [Microbacteriaceae bacterium]